MHKMKIRALRQVLQRARFAAAQDNLCAASLKPAAQLLIDLWHLLIAQQMPWQMKNDLPFCRQSVISTPFA